MRPGVGLLYQRKGEYIATAKALSACHDEALRLRVEISQHVQFSAASQEIPSYFGTIDRVISGHISVKAAATPLCDRTPYVVGSTLGWVSNGQVVLRGVPAITVSLGRWWAQ